MKILLITEQRGGKWNNVSFETLAAAQQIAQQTRGSISGVVVGKGVAALAEELAGYQIDDVILTEHVGEPLGPEPAVERLIGNVGLVSHRVQPRR